MRAICLFVARVQPCCHHAKHIYACPRVHHVSRLFIVLLSFLPTVAFARAAARRGAPRYRERLRVETYGQSVLGGVMGDFLGATICVLELAIYLALAADASRFDASAVLRLAVVVSLPQIYERLDRGEKKAC